MYRVLTRFYFFIFYVMGILALNSKSLTKAMWPETRSLKFFLLGSYLFVLSALCNLERSIWFSLDAFCKIVKLKIQIKICRIWTHLKFNVLFFSNNFLVLCLWRQAILLVIVKYQCPHLVYYPNNMNKCKKLTTNLWKFELNWLKLKFTS